jgi:hypothetical protein
MRERVGAEIVNAAGINMVMLPAGGGNATMHMLEVMETDKEVRTKAEIVSKVLEKIAVTFGPTGRRCPLGRVKSVQIDPKVGWSGGFSKCALVFPRK